jgi:very-short-patch-repair endonuclease
MEKNKQILYNFYYNKVRAKYLRKKETQAEKILWTRLRNRQVDDLKFRRQHPIGYFVPDFYCHEIKLIIELEGKIHDKKEQKEYDKLRKEFIDVWGYSIIEFKNEQIYNNIEKVLQTIIEISKKLKLSLSS